ncbi:substrate-binding periplasmic protein [Dongshaea marina]|uniref:substrate-binding periplasmic protein n=1 Tax=Dongshaea marina TaxID=2047966 RepID=UPI000D3E2EB5|nr:transporter substrate-binding domain-containing protein [Dongshaea marina]
MIQASFVAFICLLLVVLFVLPVRAGQDMCELHYVTEQSPPYNYQEEGDLKGIAVDLLRAASRIGCDDPASLDIRSHSWARSYKLARKVRQYVVFSTVRTPHRESLFHWVGPIGNSPKVLLALKQNSIVINSQVDILQYRIGVVRNDIAEEVLLQMGVPQWKLYRSNDPYKLIEMLSKNKIDLWAVNYNSVPALLKSSELSPSGVTAAYTLFNKKLYFALNPMTPPQMEESLRDSIHKIMSSSEYPHILSKYPTLSQD